MAVFLALGCYRGEDVLVYPWTITDPASGLALDITGWSISFTLKQTYSGGALITKTVGSGITLTNPTAGVLSVSLLAADTNQTAGRYFYALARTDSGAHAILTAGDWTIKDDTAF